MNDIIALTREILTPTPSELSLLALLQQSDLSWPPHATCVTQERDGALLWWRAHEKAVTCARKKAQPHTGLTPILGRQAQVAIDYLYVGDDEVLACDWQSAVITLDHFIGLR